MTFLQASGLEVMVMWECQFRRLLTTDAALREFAKLRRHPFHRAHRGRVSVRQILKAVSDDMLFGAIEVDISVPERWTDDPPNETDLDPATYFGEMCPLFCSTKVPFDIIGEHMQRHARNHGLSEEPRRLLIGGLKAKHLLLASPLLKWYMDHGMVVTDVHQVVEFRKQRCFHSFEVAVTEARREGNADPNKVMLAGLMKLLGNSSYGSMIMDKQKHEVIKYTRSVEW